MKTSLKTKSSVATEDSQFYLYHATQELGKVRADIRLMNEKLLELYSTIRMLFEHHPQETDIPLQIISTDRFNRVTHQSGFDELITEIEDHIVELKAQENRLERQLKSFSF